MKLYPKCETTTHREYAYRATRAFERMHTTTVLIRLGKGGERRLVEVTLKGNKKLMKQTVKEIITVADAKTREHIDVPIEELMKKERRREINCK